MARTRPSVSPLHRRRGMQRSAPRVPRPDRPGRPQAREEAQQGPGGLDRVRRPHPRTTDRRRRHGGAGPLCRADVRCRGTRQAWRDAAVSCRHGRAGVAATCAGGAALPGLLSLEHGPETERWVHRGAHRRPFAHPGPARGLTNVVDVLPRHHQEASSHCERTRRGPRRRSISGAPGESRARDRAVDRGRQRLARVVADLRQADGGRACPAGRRDARHRAGTACGDRAATGACGGRAGRRCPPTSPRITCGAGRRSTVAHPAISRRRPRSSSTSLPALRRLHRPMPRSRPRGACGRSMPLAPRPRARRSTRPKPRRSRHCASTCRIPTPTSRSPSCATAATGNGETLNVSSCGCSNCARATSRRTSGTRSSWPSRAATIRPASKRHAPLRWPRTRPPCIARPDWWRCTAVASAPRRRRCGDR